MAILKIGIGKSIDEELRRVWRGVGPTAFYPSNHLLYGAG